MAESVILGLQDTKMLLLLCKIYKILAMFMSIMIDRIDFIEDN